LAYRLFPIAASSAWTWKTPSTPFPAGFLGEMYKNPDMHSIIPLVEMIYSRDSTVYYFDPKDAPLLYGTV
jgi:hypothetical protein